MSDTPRTDKLYEEVWRFTNETDAVDALISMRDLCRELERENAALREVLRMAKRYVPPQAVTKEWRSKPVSECRLLDKIESVLGKEEQP